MRISSAIVTSVNATIVSMTMMIVGLSVSSTIAQELPKPGPEYDVFKKDVGTWDVEIKTSQGPATKGKEINRMLGGFWMLTDFQGKMMGLDFKGHGVYGYDSEKKQYVGTWIDSLSAKKMAMVGKYDEASHTMTFEGSAPGPDGTPAKHVIATKYKDDGTRMMTMHVQVGDKMMKMFEMRYSKAK